MKRKYPAKMFLVFVLMNFLIRYIYLFLPGAILCVIGIWNPTCLWIGLGVLLLDLVISVIDQLRICKAAVSESDNPEFNELMDAFCSGGTEAFGQVLESKIRSAPPEEE